MKKAITMLFVLVLCSAVLFGCVEKKSFSFGANDESKKNEKMNEDKDSSDDKNDAKDKEKKGKKKKNKKKKKEKKREEKNKAEKDMAEEELGSIEGIEVISGTISKPQPGELAFTPRDLSGYFAVNGALVAETTVNVETDPNGVLNFDLLMQLNEPKEVNAEIQVFKGGEKLGECAGSALFLPEGETTIRACITTKEDSPCSGEYTVRFYLDDQMIIEAKNEL